MKKLFFTIILLLNGILLNAQTKQQTIDYLTEKISGLTTHFYLDYKVTYTVSDNRITTISTWKNGNTNKNTYSFDDICNVRLVHINRKNSKNSPLSTIICVKLKSDTPIYINDVSNGTVNEEYFDITDSEYESEVNLSEKMFKALKTLAEYNCPL